MRKLFALAKKYTFFTPSKTCYGSDIGFPAIMGLAVYKSRLSLNSSYHQFLHNEKFQMTRCFDCFLLANDFKS
uniref:Uncharacterized protein n=1 Tax=Solanum lycopersicum TaxID=4081 RepID=A0A3Q7IEB8_SOLLC